ncbi:Phycocyanin [Thalassoporum mexicanum PCC 7367]|uniref:phycocyanin n=1 Tax=Thalassoporum mexicanum TaxID=3457544 RepID=UPI00029FD5DD|nr:phycocyanin [Pseudanabaena sp. PCC 7367]AFY68632.1 Phycocyanin [Pseudanabaena sp. PCC 7367]
MLSKLRQLTVDAEGRYATDDELTFLKGYIHSYELRINTYNKLRELENAIVEQSYEKVRSQDPNVFNSSGTDITAKWKADTRRVLRYSAVALLIDDTNRLKEHLLFWFQTVMQAFKAQRSCNVTYAVMQEVVKQSLTEQEAKLVCPLLELTRNALADDIKL